MPSPTPPTRGRAREDTGERLSHPARPAHIPTPALRISHFPDPSPTTLEPHSPPRLDTEGSHDRTSDEAWSTAPPGQCQVSEIRVAVAPAALTAGIPAGTRLDPSLASLASSGCRRFESGQAHRVSRLVRGMSRRPGTPGRRDPEAPEAPRPDPKLSLIHISEPTRL